MPNRPKSYFAVNGKKTLPLANLVYIHSMHTGITVFVNSRDGMINRNKS